KEGLRLLPVLEFGQIIIPEALNLLHGRGIHVGRRDVAHEARTDLVIRERAGIALQQGPYRPVIDGLLLSPHSYCFLLASQVIHNFYANEDARTAYLNRPAAADRAKL